MFATDKASKIKSHPVTEAIIHGVNYWKTAMNENFHLDFLGIPALD